MFVRTLERERFFFFFLIQLTLLINKKKGKKTLERES